MGWRVQSHSGWQEPKLPESIESIKKFAVQIGCRFLRSKDLQKASETFRQAMHLQPNDKVWPGMGHNEADRLALPTPFHKMHCILFQDLVVPGNECAGCPLNANQLNLCTKFV